VGIHHEPTFDRSTATSLAVSRQSLLTLRVIACRKWNVHPFTDNAGKVACMAFIAADSKSVRNVRRPTSPKVRIKASASAPNMSVYDCWDLFGRRAQASARASPCIRGHLEGAVANDKFTVVQMYQLGVSTE